MQYGLRRGLREKRDIDRSVARMRETGLLRRYVGKNLPAVPDCVSQGVEANFKQVCKRDLIIGAQVGLYSQTPYVSTYGL